MTNKYSKIFIRSKMNFSPFLLPKNFLFKVQYKKQIKICKTQDNLLKNKLSILTK